MAGPSAQCSQRPGPRARYNGPVAHPDNPVLSVVTRSDRVESWHRGALVVVHDGELVVAIGDVKNAVYARSVVKPLQALALLERGLHERLELTAAEIAVLCASHDGTPFHTELVRTFLGRGGLDETHLRCGPHAPFDPGTRRAMLGAGEAPSRLHNNCSGKHTGFLHLARECSDDLADYLDPASAAQREVHAAVIGMAGLSHEVPTGLDGCGAPTFWLPLARIARAFCQLANPIGVADVRATACRTILDAVGREPVALAGERRFCTALARAFPGRVFPKNGAEGVYAVALAPDPARQRWPGAIGLAVKIDDGNERGYQPVVIDALRRLGAFGEAATGASGCGAAGSGTAGSGSARSGAAGSLPSELEKWARLPILNTQKRVVGEVRAELPWPV